MISRESASDRCVSKAEYVGGTARGLRAAILALAVVLVGHVESASAATFTVNTTTDTDDGTCNGAHCSLREAMTAAESNPGSDTIAFNIPGTGVRTITVGAPCLPTIFGQVTIDGYTQPGSSPNTNPTGAINAVPLIEVKGTPACGTGFSAVFNSASLTVRGLVVNSFSSIAIIGTLATVRVEGSFIGTTPDGMSPAVTPFNAAGDGVTADGAAAIVGGTTPASRNLISGNARAIAPGGSPNASSITVVQGNLIGTNKLGTAAIPNGFGFSSGGCNGGNATLQMGGTTPEARNVISGNGFGGILMGGLGSGCGGYTAINSFIKGNFIGTDVTGTVPMGNGANNGGVGILVQSGPDIVIGGTAAGEGNVIAHNVGGGVIVQPGPHPQRDTDPRQPHLRQWRPGHRPAGQLAGSRPTTSATPTRCCRTSR